MEANNIAFPVNGPVFNISASTIEELEKEFNEPLQGESGNHFPGGVAYAD